MSSDSPTAPRLRDRLREEGQRAILAAAEQVFAEDGLGARMERIAARAGVAVGTLYNHFEDRTALVSALARSRREALLARVDAALAGAASGTAADQLRAYLAAVSEHAREHGAFLAVLVEAGEGPAKLTPPGKLLDELAARIDAVVARGIASGELRPDLAHVFAIAFVGMTRTVLVRALRAGGSLEALGAALLDLFLEGARA
jgi:AcrR family transcriptional regulator